MLHLLKPRSCVPRAARSLRAVLSFAALCAALCASLRAISAPHSHFPASQVPRQVRGSPRAAGLTEHEFQPSASGSSSAVTYSFQLIMVMGCFGSASAQATAGQQHEMGCAWWARAGQGWRMGSSGRVSRLVDGGGLTCEREGAGAHRMAGALRIWRVPRTAGVTGIQACSSRRPARRGKRERNGVSLECQVRHAWLGG